MGIEFDEEKRKLTLLHRGLDFADAEAIFDGPAFTVRDTRRDYSERRFITYGLLDERQVVGMDLARHRPQNHLDEKGE